MKGKEQNVMIREQLFCSTSETFVIMKVSFTNDLINGRMQSWCVQRAGVANIQGENDTIRCKMPERPVQTLSKQGQAGDLVLRFQLL
jgi:hypothetical protein